MKIELLKFIFVGGINTAHYYALYIIFYQLLQYHYLLAHIMATLLSIIASYFLNIYFTYKVKPSLKSFLLFPLTQVANVLIQSLCMLLFVTYLNLSPLLAPIPSVMISVPITFFITRRIVHVKG